MTKILDLLLTIAVVTYAVVFKELVYLLTLAPIGAYNIVRIQLQYELEQLHRSQKQAYLTKVNNNVWITTLTVTYKLDRIILICLFAYMALKPLYGVGV